jgi:hypothetical protein
MGKREKHVRSDRELMDALIGGRRGDVVHVHAPLADRVRGVKTRARVVLYRTGGVEESRPRRTF